MSEDAEHPEVFILFGNLALAENRATDAAVHFEKAKALAAGEALDDRAAESLGAPVRPGQCAIGGEAWRLEDRACGSGTLAVDEPANAEARQRLGKALFGLGEYEVAYAELQRAAKENASLEPAAITMGWLFTRAGNVKKGEEWMDYGAKTAPDSLAVQIGVAAWLIEQGRPEQAASHAESASKLDPKSNEVKRLLGVAARQRKDLGRCRTGL